MRFRWKDYRDHHQQKTMTLTAEEFIRRFPIHVLPPRFRYYGLLGNRYREGKLARCRQRLGMPPAAIAAASPQDYRDPAAHRRFPAGMSGLPPGSPARGGDFASRPRPSHYRHLLRTRLDHPHLCRRARWDRASAAVWPHGEIAARGGPHTLSAPPRTGCRCRRRRQRPADPLLHLAGDTGAGYNPHRLGYECRGLVQLIFSPAVAARTFLPLLGVSRAATAGLKILCVRPTGLIRKRC